MELISAAKNGDFTQVFNLLRLGNRADSRDHDNATPLYWSACHGHTTLCEVLIQAGSDVNARVKWGSTPLHAASDRGHTNCVKILIENGGNVNCQNNRGDTPLHIAAYRGNMAIVRELLLASTDTSLVNDNRKTPQEEAVEGGHTDIAERIKAFVAGKHDVLNTELRIKGPPRTNSAILNQPAKYHHSNGTTQPSHQHSNVYHSYGSYFRPSLTESICSSYDSFMDSSNNELPSSRCSSFVQENRSTNQCPPIIQRSLSVGCHMTSGSREEKTDWFGKIHNTGYPKYAEFTNDINKECSSLESLGSSNVRIDFQNKIEFNSPNLTSNGRCIATESIDFSEQPIPGQNGVHRKDLSETRLQNICNTHPLRASTGSVKDAAILSESVETYIRKLQTQLVNAYKEIEALTTEKEDLKFKCSTVLTRLSDTEKLLEEKNGECEKLKSLVDNSYGNLRATSTVANTGVMTSPRMRGSTNGMYSKPNQQIEISSLQAIVKDKLIDLSQRFSQGKCFPGGADKVWVPGEDYVIIGDKQTTWLGVTSSRHIPLAVEFTIKHLKTGNRLCLTMLLTLDDPTSSIWSFSAVVQKRNALFNEFNKHPNVRTSLHRYEGSTERFKKFVTAPKSKSVKLCAKTMFSVTMETKSFETFVEAINRDRDSSSFCLSLYGSYMEFIMQISYQLLCVVNDLEKHTVIHGNISENTIVFDKTLRPLIRHLDILEGDKVCANSASTSGDYINLPTKEQVSVQSDFISVCELLHRTLYSNASLPCVTVEEQNLQRRFSLVEQVLHDVTLSTSSVPTCQSILRRVGCILYGPSGSDVRSQSDCEVFIRQRLLHLASNLESTRYKDMYPDYISIPESVDLHRPEVQAHFLCTITAIELWENFQSCNFEKL